MTIQERGTMERVTKAHFLLALIVVFLAVAEGGRDAPMKDDVYNPQNFFGFGWFPFFPFFHHFPWFGGMHKVEAGQKDRVNGKEGLDDVPKVYGNAAAGYP
ncbi:unnamed protein product [Ilex paraguariensis]|uniref:Glycine-rich protein n=1 Tax=Ilex paraguariensis TaxID=185542 RepID=A0ABC8T1Z0_9AQUA